MRYTAAIIFFGMLVTAAGTAQQPQLVVPIGHSGLISDVFFSPDDKLIITTANEEENLVKIWEAESGKLLRTINAHADIITSISVSRDGKYLLSAGHDEYARIWEVSSGRKVKEFNHRYSNWIEKSYFSRDEKKIILVSAEVMEIVDRESGKPLLALADTAGMQGRSSFSLPAIISTDYSPDGRYLASVHSDSTVRIWDPGTGKLLSRLRHPAGRFIFCRFSPDSKYLLLNSDQHNPWVVDPSVGKKQGELSGHTATVFSIAVSADGRQALTGSLDKTARRWDLQSGKLLQTYTGAAGWVVFVKFSPDGKFVLTGSLDGQIRLWDTNSGKLLKVVAKPGIDVGRLNEKQAEELFIFLQGSFNHQSTQVVTAAASFKATITDIRSGKELAETQGVTAVTTKPAFSPDGRLMAVLAGKVEKDKLSAAVQVWDMQTGTIRYSLGAHRAVVTAIRFSPDGNYIATASADSTTRVWDAASGKPLFTLSAHTEEVYDCQFSNNSKYLVTRPFNSDALIWELETGKQIGRIRHPAYEPGKSGIFQLFPTGNGSDFYVQYYDGNRTEIVGPEGSIMASLEADKDSISHIMTDPQTRYLVYARKKSFYLKDISGKGVQEFPTGHNRNITAMGLSHDGKKLLTAAADSLVQLWDIPTGRLIWNYKNNIRTVMEFAFSPDNTVLLAKGYDSTIQVRETATGKLLHLLRDQSLGFYTMEFTRDGHFLVTQTHGHRIRVWDMRSGLEIMNIPNKFFDTYRINPVSGQFVVDNRFSVEVYNMVKGQEPLFRIIHTSPGDYLVVDSSGRYDGTISARKTLYLACSNEVVELEQLKDQLWVPGLAERLLKGEAVNSSSLNELNICELAPRVEQLSTDGSAYRFRITPRRGGLGETVVYVNGIEAKRFPASGLKRTGTQYELLIPGDELNSYMVPGQENRVMARAFTSGNHMASRGAVITAQDTKKPQSLPNLYAVMIGISDYKGNELDLKYAAKDATDLSAALSVAARKLLNTDGKEHVFVYNLTTSADRYLLPEKNSIRMTLEEIGKKITSNDVLMIFFAGHGIMAGNESGKQFYFLTAEASSLSATGDVKAAGISTTELTEWIQPQRIKAQKRILIFDACNSGQAIKDFVKLGDKDQQYLAARNNDRSQLVKAIDKLNEKSGLFILSAAASDQSAYEMGRYSQGLLTYALLKSVKQDPGILEDGKFLNVGRWFGAAEKSVSDMAKETGARQEPQIVSTTNFNVGVVDEEVMAKIVLPQEKPLFTASNFQNSDEAIADDDMEFSKSVNFRLSDLSARGNDSHIVYVTASQSPDAYTLTGRYTIKDKQVTVTVNVKQGKLIRRKFEVSGSLENMEALAAALVDNAVKALD